MEGSITVDGFDLTKKYDYKKLRSHIGMLFQYPEHQLFDETVKRDVGFGPRNIGIKGDELDARVKEAIELVGLNYDEIAERSPFELSGGQMRRVALAGVLAMKPQILVLDEPTAGLDPRGKGQILSLIHSLRKECPTVVMISHNMDEIFENCNRVALLVDGRLKGVFTPNELYKNSALIEESGLEMPTIFKIARELNKRGYNIDDIKNTADFADKLAAQYLSRQGGEGNA
jgi:energy-coupling factor transport system ATP-binding protein